MRIRAFAVIFLAALTATLGAAMYDPDEGTPRIGGDLLLPVFTNQYFHASGRCDGCHGHDPQGNASVDLQGNDISPVEYWRSTMMANAAKDPYWKAKVRHEVLLNPAHRSAIEDKCATCHAPMGRYTYHLSGAGPFPLDSLRVDSLAMDGVSCMSCHRQDSIGLGSNHSGLLHYMADPMEFGPYEKPFQAAMQNFVGLTPYYSEHIRSAGICASCHSLLTETLDLNGNPTGTTFVEQATYHEWQNSSAAQSSPKVTCQSCHMPRITDPVIIAANIAFLPYRSPYPLHQLAGGNRFMLKLMQDNIDTLGIIAAPSHFDRTIAATEQMLRGATAELNLDLESVTPDTVRITLRIRNKAGHKFPSGYPSRRAFVRFDLVSDEGDTLFSTGRTTPDFHLIGEDTGFEPHHNIISQPDQVQIYEMVMGDVNGDVTHVLSYASTHLKDNRLTPVGFSTSHAVYDTTRIVGHALTDADFNHDALGNEGSGSDIIHFHIPLNGYTGRVDARAQLYYQSVPPTSVQHMFQSQQPDIDLFQTLYDAADRAPFLMRSDSLMGIEITSIKDREPSAELRLWPNPTTGVFRLNIPAGTSIRQLLLMDMKGQRLQLQATDTRNEYDISHLPKGMYNLLIETDKGKAIRKIIRTGER